MIIYRNLILGAMAGWSLKQLVLWFKESNSKNT